MTCKYLTYNLKLVQNSGTFRDIK